MTMVAWAAKTPTDFTQAVIQMCKNLGWTAIYVSWIMSCMAFESGETFSPSIKNAAGSGATGLIQFMPSTARDLGTTIENLELLSAESQLSYVEHYFRRYAKRIHDLPDMYMAILLPSKIGKPNDSVLFSGGVPYRQNSGLDVNHDGKVTKLEAAALVQRKFDRGMQPGFAAEFLF